MLPVLFGLLVAPVHAGEPSVQVSDAGLTVTCVMDADEATVKALMADTDKVYGASEDLESYTITSKGGCSQIETESKGLISLRLRTERCPSSDSSWHDRLVSSDDFDEYDVKWYVRPVQGGTEVVYQLKASLSAPIPDKTVYKAAGEAARTQLTNLQLLLD
jgi:hypothetical protein